MSYGQTKCLVTMVPLLFTACVLALPWMMHWLIIGERVTRQDGLYASGAFVLIWVWSLWVCYDPRQGHHSMTRERDLTCGWQGPWQGMR